MPCYFLTGKDVVRQVLLTDAGNYRRGRLFDRLAQFLGNGIATSDGQRHLRNRRLMQPAFHRAQIAAYLAQMVRTSTNVMRSWQPGECRAVEEDMQKLTSVIVGEALFSNSLDRGALEAVLHDINTLISQSMARAVMPRTLSHLLLPMNRRYDRTAARVRQVITAVVTERRTQPDEHHDLLSILLNARHEETGKGLTDVEIHDEVVTLFVAGVETTGRTLAWLFYEVGRRPDIRHRLLAEIDEVLGGKPVTVEHLPRLTYTRQVIDEVLRHYALWVLTRRPINDVDLGGFHIPADSEVIVSPHALHHHPGYFPDPNRFDPDRWSPEGVSSIPRGAYLPFAAGTHQCIGQAFALTELMVVATTVLSRVMLIPSSDKPVRTKVTNVPVPSPLPMIVTPRSA